MAVTILDQSVVCDGLDARCMLSDGRIMTFHFIETPVDLQATVNSLEASYPPFVPVVESTNSYKIDYIFGGVTWTFPSTFNQLPTISVSIVLKDLIDNIFPLSTKIVSLTTSEVIIKAYKSVLDINNDIVFSECDTNDVVLHLTVE